MTVVFLTSASTSPWSRPGDWTDAGHTVNLVGAGGRGGTSTVTGTSYRPGWSGGGGAHVLLTYSSGALASTYAFRAPAQNTDNVSANRASSGGTLWGNSSFTNTRYIEGGQAGASAATLSGTAGGDPTTTSTGTPPAPAYTTSQSFNGGGGGSCGGDTTSAAGGGGGAGPSGVGGAGGGSIAAARGGGGGGGGNGGTNGANGAASGVAGAGGGTGGGTAGASSGSPAGGAATANTAGGGGGGFLSATASANSSGGAGASDDLFTGYLVTGTTQAGSTSTIGMGGGGGGGGSNSVNTAGATTNGGAGGYGGGGGGAGGTRNATGTRTGGNGGSGLIVVTYTEGAPPDTTTVTEGDVLFTGKSVTGIELGLVTQASVAFTGQTVTVKDGDTVLVTKADVTVAGKSVTGIELGAVAKATITVVGKTVTIRETDVTPVLKATVTVTGQTVTIRETELTPVLKASVTVTGKSVLVTELIPITKASVTVAGQAVTPTDTAGADIIPVAKADVLYTGQTVTSRETDTTPVLKASVTAAGKTVAVLDVVPELPFTSRQTTVLSRRTLLYRPITAPVTVRDAEVMPVLKATVTVTGKTVTVRELEVTPVLKATVTVVGTAVGEIGTVPVNKASVTFAGQTVTLRDLASGVEPVSAGSVTFTGQTVTVLDIVPELPFTSRQTTVLSRRTLLYRPITTPTGETPAPTIADLPFPQGQTSILARWALLYPSGTIVPLVTAPGIDIIPVFPAAVTVTGKTVTVLDVVSVLKASVTFAGQTVTIPADTPAVAAKLVTSYTPGAPRQDWTGHVGVEFVLTGNITFDQIGLRCGASNTGNHVVDLVDRATGTVLRSGTIDLTGAIEGQFYYTAITPITLVGGTVYALGAQTTGFNGQYWSDAGPTTLRDTVPGSVFASYKGGGTWNTSLANFQFHGVDLGYATGAPVTDTVTVGPGTVLFTGKTVTVTDIAGLDVIPIGPGNIRFTGQNVAVTGELITTLPPGGGGGAFVPSWRDPDRKRRRRYRALEEIEKRIDARIEKLKAETKVTQEKVAEVLSAPAHLLETEQGFEQLLIEQTRITVLLLDTQKRAERVRQERIELARLAQIAAFEADEEEAAIMLLLT